MAKLTDTKSGPSTIAVLERGTDKDHTDGKEHGRQPNLDYSVFSKEKHENTHLSTATYLGAKSLQSNVGRARYCLQSSAM